MSIIGGAFLLESIIWCSLDCLLSGIQRFFAIREQYMYYCVYGNSSWYCYNYGRYPLLVMEVPLYLQNSLQPCIRYLHIPVTSGDNLNGLLLIYVHVHNVYCVSRSIMAQIVSRDCFWMLFLFTLYSWTNMCQNTQVLAIDH